jgi:hypothetical protein
VSRLPRRELFDIKLQLLSAEDPEETVRYADTPSDLVRGVYEGGLKTWECSADLAQYLLDSYIERNFRRILEVSQIRLHECPLYLIPDRLAVALLYRL